MTRLRYRLAALGLLGWFAACDGDEAPGLPDASTVVDGTSSDSSPDPCYRERDDRTNGTTAEPTGLVFRVGWVAICGAVDGDHPGGAFLDADHYELVVTTGGPAVLRLTAPGAGALDRLDLVVKKDGTRTAVGRVHGGLGVAVLTLSAGSYTIAVEAQGPAGAAVPYQIVVVEDDPALRCPIGTLPAVPDYRESDESAAGHRANDVVAVRITPALLTQPTAISFDAPEATQLAVSIGGRTTIAGTSADVEPADDPYHDRDTYAVYTGQSTNLLEVRAVWPGTVADLDLFAFEAEHADDAMGRPVQLLTGELLVTAVKPSTLYWIWVGGAPQSEQLPASYALAICGHELALGADF